MARINLINDSKITTKDILLSEKYFSLDTESINGKTIRRIPILIHSNIIEISTKLLRI